jgi:hypothetical protein
MTVPPLSGLDDEYRLEELFPLRDAGPLFPGGRDLASLYRYSTRGLRGEILRTVKAGATRCTTRRWIADFFERLSMRQQTPSTTDRSYPPTCAAGRLAPRAGGAFCKGAGEVKPRWNLHLPRHRRRPVCAPDDAARFPSQTVYASKGEAHETTCSDKEKLAALDLLGAIAAFAAVLFSGQPRVRAQGGGVSRNGSGLSLPLEERVRR